MLRASYISTLLGVLVPLCITSTVFAQGQRTTPFATAQGDTIRDAQDHRPPLFFREAWKPPTAAAGTSCQECNQVTQKLVTQEFLDNPNLEVKLYGPGAKQLIVT